MPALLMQLIRLLGFLGGSSVARSAGARLAPSLLSKVPGLAKIPGLGFAGDLAATTLGGTAGSRLAGASLEAGGFPQEDLPIGQELLLNLGLGAAGTGSHLGFQKLLKRPLAGPISSNLAQVPGLAGGLALAQPMLGQQPPDMQIPPNFNPRFSAELYSEPMDMMSGGETDMDLELIRQLMAANEVI